MDVLPNLLQSEVQIMDNVFNAIVAKQKFPYMISGSNDLIVKRSLTLHGPLAD